MVSCASVPCLSRRTKYSPPRFALRAVTTPPHAHETAFVRLGGRGGDGKRNRLRNLWRGVYNFLAKHLNLREAVDVPKHPPDAKTVAALDASLSRRDEMDSPRRVLKRPHPRLRKREASGIGSHPPRDADRVARPVRHSIRILVDPDLSDGYKRHILPRVLLSLIERRSRRGALREGRVWGGPRWPKSHEASQYAPEEQKGGQTMHSHRGTWGREVGRVRRVKGTLN
jgi:hypothetical protein